MLRFVWMKNLIVPATFFSVLCFEITRHSTWDRKLQAGAQLMTRFGLACELQHDWHNDIESVATLFSNLFLIIAT